MSEKNYLRAATGRRTALRTIGGAIAFGVGLGSVGSAAAVHEESHQENYADIKFNPQRTTGESVRVARYEPKGDGFITIHTWDLIEEQNGSDTICGVSGLFEPGEYSNVEVQLFDDGTGYSPAFGDRERLEEDQPLVAVPHRDRNDNGSFDFVTEENPAHADIPFTNGTQVRDDLPVDGATNDWADVKVVSDNRNDGTSED
ncbi:hypothetical protein SAMN04488063_1562 [Halopelagius inordinatus]|uniref:DUF7282 domain-containing protein n=1 Tax=Halopelagius inordinatus TaxID=553467 RepID=A0A1I2PLJ3_9EURY|nr:hypothetical protein [Halopelagius inordinatus]SFG14516.1 hypothetical protein SAMN04488063_1562 [Halopelagius inordinatus]